MKLSVNLKERSYNIKIEKGLFKNIAKEVGDVFKGEKIFIITDDNVEKYYGNEILSAIKYIYLSAVSRLENGVIVISIHSFRYALYGVCNEELCSSV